MKQYLLNLLVCPVCKVDFEKSSTETLVCTNYGLSFSLHQGLPIFSPVPLTIDPSDKVERPSDSGTHWRQANWKFIGQQIRGLPPGTLVLGVGAGRGDFNQIFKSVQNIVLDIYPYPEIDLACDLTQSVPFLEGIFDRVVLLSVWEYMYDPRHAFSSIFRILKPGGMAIIAILFLLKIHQAPFDFTRFTHFALQKMGIDAGIEIEKMEGFYDPAGLLEEATRYYRLWEIPKLHRFQRIIARFLLSIIAFHTFFLEGLSGKGRVKDPNQYDFPVPSDYQLVFHNPERGSSR